MTQQCMASLGSAIAPKKCILFSTAADIRAAMRAHKWPGGVGLIPVATSARDLGAQVNYGRVARAGIITTRVRKAVSIAKHIESLPCPGTMRCTLINTKASPKGLYGCESSPCPAGLMSSLGASFKAAITPGVASMGAQGLAFQSWGMRNPGPSRTVLMLRARKVRRMWGQLW